MDASAGWYPDPLGRYDHRYWDGTRWTDHAARAGQTVTDPVDVPGWGDRPSRTGTAVEGTEGLAVVSLVLSIVWLFGIGSIAGIATGVIARRRIRESGGARTGGELALAGIIVGILTLLLTVLVALALGALLVRDVTFTAATIGLG